MKLTITGRHIDITDAIRSYAEEKVQKLDRFDKISRVQLTMNAEGDRQIAELIVSAPPGKQIVITEQTQDMYASIDKAIDRLERQLRKHKEKIKQGPRRAKKFDASESAPEGEVYEDEEE